MSVGVADLQKGIVAAWTASDLDASFTAMWDSDDITQYAVLNDQEAAPKQPFPYCVMSETPNTVVSRMSNSESVKQHIRSTTITFYVHAKQTSTSSAKIIAADLAEEIMKQFGGHPTVSPKQTITLINGNFLQTQYQTDYGVRTGDEEYQWLVSYELLVDVPVSV